MYEKFSESAKRVLFYARYDATQRGGASVKTEHLVLGLLKERNDVVEWILKRVGISPEELQEELAPKIDNENRILSPTEITMSDEVKKSLAYAMDEAKKLIHDTISSEHILLGILRHKESRGCHILKNHNLHLYVAREEIVSYLQKKAASRRKKEKPLLDEFARNFNDLAFQGVFDPLIGREKEIERIVQILSRRKKNSPVLLGEPGVGKTAIVEGLAQKINSGESRLALANKKIYAIDLSLIVAGTKYRGQFEERLKGLLKELKDSPDIIVFIDEIHNLIGAGSAEGSLDAASILKPALSRGEIQCIGATTPRDYHKHIERDRALVRRFQPIKINSPDDDETFKILNGLRSRYEQYHNIHYTDEAVKAAVYMSGRYITDRFQPDKAIDVIDEAGARVKLRRKSYLAELRKTEERLDEMEDKLNNAITSSDFEEAMKYREEELSLKERAQELTLKCDLEKEKAVHVAKVDIEEVISGWTGIPVTSLDQEESEKLSKLESYLHQRIVSQNDAITAISRAIRRSRAGLKNPGRPVGSFLFLGPTGVGKTEVAKSVVEFLFNSEKALVRYDMSEYMEKHSVAKMIGSPPGYVGHEEGGSLTKKIKRNPYSVILLDEIEKAHPEVLNVLLQILEDGVLTDAYGDQIDFKNTFIIMTSNIGSKNLLSGKKLGFSDPSEKSVLRDARELVMREVKKVLSPEFLNRIDEIIVFDPLTDEDLKEIAKLNVERLNTLLSQKGITIEVEEEACRWLVEKSCGDRTYGARPLRRAIQRHIEDEMAEKVIKGIGEGASLFNVTVSKDKLVIKEVRKETTAGIMTD